MAVISHLQLFWRAWLLNIVFAALLLTTHTVSFGDAMAQAARVDAWPCAPLDRGVTADWSANHGLPEPPL